MGHSQILEEIALVLLNHNSFDHLALDVKCVQAAQCTGVLQSRPVLLNSSEVLFREKTDDTARAEKKQARIRALQIRSPRQARKVRVEMLHRPMAMWRWTSSHNASPTVSRNVQRLR